MHSNILQLGCKILTFFCHTFLLQLFSIKMMSYQIISRLVCLLKYLCMVKDPAWLLVRWKNCPLPLPRDITI